MNSHLFNKLNQVSERLSTLFGGGHEKFADMKLKLHAWDCTNDTLTLEFKLYLFPNNCTYVSLDDFKIPNLYTMVRWIDQIVDCEIFTNCQNFGGVTHIPKYEVEKVKDGLYKIELKDYRQYKVRG